MAKQPLKQLNSSLSQTLDLQLLHTVCLVPRYHNCSFDDMHFRVSNTNRTPTSLLLGANETFSVLRKEYYAVNKITLL